MQRTVSKAAIRAGKKNDMAGFFQNIAELMKHRDQNGSASEHNDKIKEYCEAYKSREDLTGTQICLLALLYCHFYVEMETAYALMDKALKKEPNNDFIKREKLFMQYFDGQQDEAKEEYKKLKAGIKDNAIAADVKLFFDTKAKIVEEQTKIFELFGQEKWAEADAMIEKTLKTLGGINVHNLEMYRLKMDPLRMQNKMKETAEFYMNLGKQTPSSVGYYQYAGDTYLDLGMKKEAAAAYSIYYKYQYQDMESLDKYLAIIDKNAQIETLKHLIKAQIVQDYQKQEVQEKLSGLGVSFEVSNDSDEEEAKQKNEQKAQEFKQHMEQHQQQQQANGNTSTERREGQISSERQEQPKVQTESRQEQTHVQAEQQYQIKVQQEQPQVAQQAPVQQQEQPVQQQGNQEQQQVGVAERNDSACCTIF